MRTSARRGGAIVLARSDDGEHLEPIAELDKDRFGAASLERPALAPLDGGGWRLYLSCATPGSKHWWICALDARSLERLADAQPRTVLPGDERTGVKDPVIRRRDGAWHAWICCHPLEEPGEEDRMATAHATSADGLDWTWRGTVLEGRAGAWDARGARVTAVLADGRASYDGRATKEENFSERTGLAVPAGPAPGGSERLAVPAGPAPGRSERLAVPRPAPPHAGRLGATLAAAAGGPVSDARYLDLLELPGGAHRLYYEAPLPDGSHELRTELVPPG